MRRTLVNLLILLFTFTYPPTLANEPDPDVILDSNKEQRADLKERRSRKKKKGRKQKVILPAKEENQEEDSEPVENGDDVILELDESN